MIERSVTGSLVFREIIDCYYEKGGIVHACNFIGNASCNFVTRGVWNARPSGWVPDISGRCNTDSCNYISYSADHQKDWV